jgi:uncharacterized protein (DUF305 family)
MKLQWILAGSLSVAATGFALMGMSSFKEPGNRIPSFAEDMETSMSLMDREMYGAPMSGTVDHDFAAMMIPHHQGAVDMAKAELSYGKDPVMRRLAEEIIVDQKSEIDLMNLWLRKHAETGKEICRG